MAKQGGRKNLLAYRSPPVKPDEPVPYPRVEWFDHDHPEEDDEAGQPAQLEEHDKEPAKEGYVFHKPQEFYSYGQCVYCKIYRGYYTVARRYEFYVRVARTISHE